MRHRSYRLPHGEQLLQAIIREFAERELAPLVLDAERTGTSPRQQIIGRELGLDAD